MINNSLVIERLKDNKKRFKPKEYEALMYLARFGNDGYDYRSSIESLTDKITYLPSFIQRTEDKLKLAGLEFAKCQAREPRFKLYALRPLKEGDSNE